MIERICGVPPHCAAAETEATERCTSGSCWNCGTWLDHAPEVAGSRTCVGIPLLWTGVPQDTGTPHFTGVPQLTGVPAGRGLAARTTENLSDPPGSRVRATGDSDGADEVGPATDPAAAPGTCPAAAPAATPAIGPDILLDRRRLPDLTSGAAALGVAEVLVVPGVGTAEARPPQLRQPAGGWYECRTCGERLRRALGGSV